MKLAVFPSDDLEVYIKKGEIRKNYFNPNNIFSKIYIINMSAKKAIDEKTIQFMCGTAKFEIIFVGEYSQIELLFKRNSIADKISKILMDKKIDIIRTYGILFNSFSAAYCAKNIGVPFILSLHDNYNGTRYITRASKEYHKWIFYNYWKHHERKILHDASAVIAVYGYAKKYALEMGVPEKKISLIYNRIDPGFKYSNRKKFPKFTIINTMGHNWMKNQETLVRTMTQLPDVQLLLIGRGPKHDYLVKLSKDLGCSDRITFIERVMNKDLPSYYQRSHVFASSIIQGGVGIPDLEAFATGIPVIHAKYFDEPNPDLLSDCAIRVDNTPEAFARAIKRLKSDKALYDKYVKLGLQLTKKINHAAMSNKEEAVYRTVLQSHKNPVSKKKI